MRRNALIALVCLSLCGQAGAQIQDLSKTKWQRVERDSLPAQVDSMLPYEQVINHQSTDNKYRVVTNPFKHNWWISADAGIHTFRGDYSGHRDFENTLSPDFNISAGKWFTPVWGLELQTGFGISRGFSEQWTPYAKGGDENNPPYHTEDGTPYWKLKTKWWDINANVVLNLSRLFYGWEGYDADELFNQFKLAVGFGGVHHIGNFDHWGEFYGGPHNEWYGNFEVRYNRFFNRDKAWSLDVKLRGRFYETHFDMSPLNTRRWDYNLGLQLGATYYFNRRGWERLTPAGSINYFIAPPPVIVKKDCPEYKTFTFFIFYPNNYSGRDDAPVVADADVNSMDYLAGGIFTSRRFKNEKETASRLHSPKTLRSLKTENIPTEKATFTENPSGVIRGYEISKEALSLPMTAEALQAFYDAAGYYYSPIYMGDKTWHYRVDDETRTQKLLSAENYKETTSYGLNAHAGLEIVRDNMPVDEGSDLYSFADVYAALYGNEGYISNYTDPEAVKAIQEILESGTILHVQSEGLATSQDNFTGKDAEAVGLYRNRTLSHFRALSPIKWLRESGKFKNVAPGSFSLNTLSEPIGRVDDASTRELNAKLHRCARIKITYVIQK